MWGGSRSMTHSSPAAGDPLQPFRFFPFTRNTHANMSDVQEPSKVSNSRERAASESPDADARRPPIPQSNANWNSTVGGIKETVGNVTGITSLAQSGSEQRASGEAEYKLAQTQEYVEGTADRIGGKVDRVLGAVTGDKAKEASGLAQETKGKAQQGELCLGSMQVHPRGNLLSLSSSAAANSS